MSDPLAVGTRFAWFYSLPGSHYVSKFGYRDLYAEWEHAILPVGGDLEHNTTYTLVAMGQIGGLKVGAPAKAQQIMEIAIWVGDQYTPSHQRIFMDYRVNKWDYHRGSPFMIITQLTTPSSGKLDMGIVARVRGAPSFDSFVIEDPALHVYDLAKMTVNTEYVFTEETPSSSTYASPNAWSTFNTSGTLTVSAGV